MGRIAGLANSTLFKRSFTTPGRGPIKEAGSENLNLGPGATTKLACPDMKAEQAIGKALIETGKYKIESNELHLIEAAGKVSMKFQAVV